MIALADVAVTVKDAKASAEWWQQKLGFGTHTVGRPGGHAIMVAPPGDRFVLHLCQGFAPPDPGNSGIAFVTDEIESLVARMLAGGVVFPEPLTKQSWGSMAKFEDPDGNVFWLLEAPTAFIRSEAGRRADFASTAPRPTPPVKKDRRARPRRRGASGRP
jgi:predicted enzyme related to lactoylglutathione lyase